MDAIIAMLGLTPDQANAIIAGLAAGALFKGVDLLLALLKKLAKKTDTKLDDDVIDAIAAAVHKKIVK
jgi:hypothetical protein